METIRRRLNSSVGTARRARPLARRMLFVLQPPKWRDPTPPRQKHPAVRAAARDAEFSQFMVLGLGAVARRLEVQVIECEFSDCRRYRYTWMMVWDRTKPPCAFIGLNPSTADELGPDPTVRRCVNYAQCWGYGRLIMLNLFAFRATDPKDMKAQDDPVGPDNNRFLRTEVGLVTMAGGVIIAAWGTHGRHLGRHGYVRGTVLHGLPLHYLKLTKDGHPGHPLYLKGDLKPQRWE